ncbi:HNH endonuclease signature motif containing protein [Salsipaludibacter albus]|uniref:HNH endonuclease signature motif containing protein n=1 Tax=Salsipaludibacter albus TaxID=2849650 RepID=UPI001EE3DD3A|nr:HNH endonuclease [Salsipaludibacter albus]
MDGAAATARTRWLGGAGGPWHAIEPHPDFAGLDDAGLEDEVRRSAGAAAAASARLLVVLGEFIVRGAWAWQGFRTPGQWLSWALGMAPSTSREQVRVALALRTFTATCERFVRGELSYSKVRAITRCGEPKLERLLLVYADNAPASQLERIVQTFRHLDDRRDPYDERGVRVRHRGDSVRLTIDVPVEAGLRAVTLLDRLVEVMDAQAQPANDELPGERPSDRPPSGPIAQRRADAFVHALDLAIGHVDQDLTGAARTTLVLQGDVDSTVDALAHTDQATNASAEADDVEPTGDTVQRRRPASVVVQGRHGGLRRLSRHVLRRLACDAAIRRVATRDGLPVDVGHTTRVIPFRLREALRARDGTCRFPGCAATRHLHAHHVVHWADGGPTDLSNLLLLCGAHHRVVHAKAWEVRLHDDGRASFRAPDAAHPMPSHLALVGGDPGASAEAASRADPRSLQPPGWDGERLHLDDALAIMEQELGRVIGFHLVA